MNKRLQFIFVLLFSSEIIFSVLSEPFPVLEQNHNNEENVNQPELSKSLVSANVTKIVNETKLLGFGEDCSGSLVCDPRKHLTCSEATDCECDPNASSILVYSKSQGRCVEEIDSSKEFGHSLEDTISEVDDDDMNDMTFDSQSFEDSQEHVDHHGDEKMPDTVPAGDEPNKIKKEVDENDGGDLRGADVGNSGTAQPCTNDEQCRSSKLGNYSRCIVNTASCECYDTEKSGAETRSVVLVNGICYINRTINDVCKNHSECEATIPRAWCHTDLETAIKTCQCTLEHYWESSLKECLPFGRNGLDSKCKTNYQCSEERALGPLSRCVVDTGKCECYDADDPTVYYSDTKRCYKQKSLRSFCSDEKECEASLGMDSFCGNHTDFKPSEKVCQCLEGKSCEKVLEGRPSISTYTMIVFVVAGVVMLIGIVLCFVLRKNDRYDMVSQSP